MTLNTTYGPFNASLQFFPHLKEPINAFDSNSSGDQIRSRLQPCSKNPSEAFDNCCNNNKVPVSIEIYRSDEKRDNTNVFKFENRGTSGDTNTFNQTNKFEKSRHIIISPKSQCSNKANENQTKTNLYFYLAIYLRPLTNTRNEINHKSMLNYNPILQNSESRKTLKLCNLNEVVSKEGALPDSSEKMQNNLVAMYEIDDPAHMHPTNLKPGFLIEVLDKKEILFRDTVSLENIQYGALKCNAILNHNSFVMSILNGKMMEDEISCNIYSKLFANVHQKASMCAQFKLYMETEVEQGLLVGTINNILRLISLNRLLHSTKNLSVTMKKKKNTSKKQGRPKHKRTMPNRKITASANRLKSGIKIIVRSCRDPKINGYSIIKEYQTNKLRKIEDRMDKDKKIDDGNNSKKYVDIASQSKDSDHEDLSNDSYKISQEIIQKSSISDYYIVTAEEKHKVTDYLYIIMAQMKPSVFSHEDKCKKNRKNRSNITLGYPGLRCRHCGGIERGNYFPLTCRNLQASPPVIHNHLLQCTHISTKMKKSILHAKARHKDQLSRIKSTQVSFFERIWLRMHDPNFVGGGQDGIDKVNDTIRAILSGTQRKSRSPIKCNTNNNVYKRIQNTNANAAKSTSGLDENEKNGIMREKSSSNGPSHECSKNISSLDEIDLNIDICNSIDSLSDNVWSSRTFSNKISDEFGSMNIDFVSSPTHDDVCHGKFHHSQIEERVLQKV